MIELILKGTWNEIKEQIAEILEKKEIEEVEEVLPMGALPPLSVALPAPLLDSKGVEWDVNLHVGTRTKMKDGTWKAKRNNTPPPVTVAAEETDAITNFQTFTEYVKKIHNEKAATYDDMSGFLKAEGADDISKLTVFELQKYIEKLKEKYGVDY